MTSTFRPLALCITISLLFFNASAQNGAKLIEQTSIQSTNLNRAVHYSVYLPADYTTSERAYPIVYLLHGYTGDNTDWLQFGEINRFADKAISEGTIPPMIIVMPDADSSWYINAYDGKENYEDFFIQEFIPFIEKTYRVKSQKRYRGVAGLSMGGYGTLMYALKYPQLFVAAAPLSAAVWDDNAVSTTPDKTYDNIFGQLYGRGLKGKDRLNAAWYSNSVLKIVEKKTSDDLKKVKYWIDCGDDDFLTKGNCLLHIALTEKAVPHEFRMRDGAHTWTYWRTGITDALQFIGDNFRQK